MEEGYCLLLMTLAAHSETTMATLHNFAAAASDNLSMSDEQLVNGRPMRKCIHVETIAGGKLDARVIMEHDSSGAV